MAARIRRLAETASQAVMVKMKRRLTFHFVSASRVLQSTHVNGFCERCNWQVHLTEKSAGLALDGKISHVVSVEYTAPYADDRSTWITQSGLVWAALSRVDLQRTEKCTSQRVEIQNQ